MADHKTHANCEHKAIAYCRQHDVAFCEGCGREWGSHVAPPNYGYPYNMLHGNSVTIPNGPERWPNTMSHAGHN